MENTEGISLQSIEREMVLENTTFSNTLLLLNEGAETKWTPHKRAEIEEIKRSKIIRKRGCLKDRIEFLENEYNPSLLAKRAGLGWNIYEKDKKIAKVKSNIFGTQYIVEKLPEKKEICYILYTAVHSESGPRSFQVFFDSLEGSECRTTKKLSQRVKERRGEYVKMVNKRPYYSTETNSYVLNFNGRVTLPSVRNFQVIHPKDTTYITLTFGKIDSNEYVLDYTYPWSALNAFSISLSALGFKFGCD